jgi:hypothetical protein
MNEADMQQYAMPVEGRNLGWAKSAYAMNNIPIVQIVALGNGAYAIVIMAPAGGDPPDWRNLRTYKRPPFWQRIDFARWAPWLIVLAIVAGVGWVLVNGLPAAVADIAPEIKVPVVELPKIELPSWAPKIELPDIGGAVQDATDKAMAPVREAIDAATRIAMGVAALAVGLVVLWLLFTFRGTIGGIAGGVAGMMRRGEK